MRKNRSIHSRRQLAWVGLLLVLLPTVVLAHNPIFVPDTVSSWTKALRIPDHRVSWALYGRLAAPREIDYFAFEGRAGEVAVAELLIPRIEGLENFRLSLGLVGPGLRPRRGLPVALPKDTGGVVVPDNGGKTIFKEPYSGTSYWVRQKVRLTLPKTGRYYLVLWSPQNMVGKYTLAVGTREQRASGPAGTSGSIRDFFAHPVGTDVPYPPGVALDTNGQPVR